jgi:sensor domain CHASE-containing protein
VNNDPNKVFGKALINVYLLGVSNPKGCVHSQPQNHFYMKQYKEPSHFSLCLFIFIFFFILVGAMSESVLKRLRQKARKEVERKVEALRREQIEKEITEHVRLTKVIYVELLVSRTPIT